MWKLSQDRWRISCTATGPAGNLSYRYCRNGQCGYADDAETPGLYGAGREVHPMRSRKHRAIRSKLGGLVDAPPTTLPAVEAAARAGFSMGSKRCLLTIPPGVHCSGGAG